MGYFDKDYLEHHQILGAKWGKKNGPPYPLGSGDHSSSEKKAAAAAGVKVGKDSGKGSIENVKKKKKAPLTEEEKRLKAEEARLKGDSKNINKYMDKLTTDELRDAQTRAQIKKSLSEEKQSKAEKDKRDAMLSGDKEKVKEYATKMTYNELSEAMNKVDLMQKLNYEPPKPTTMDKINEAVKKVDTARDWMEKSLKAYDALAAINNTFNKDNQWPRAQLNKSGDKKDDKKDKESGLEKMAKKITSDAQNAKAENDRRLEVKLEKRESKASAKEDKIEAKKQEKEERENGPEKVKANAAAEKRSELNPTFNKYKIPKETDDYNRATSWIDNEQDLDSNNIMMKMSSREIDKTLTANENKMFEAISNPDAYDKNGNFNWNYYSPSLYIMDDKNRMKL